MECKYCQSENAQLKQKRACWLKRLAWGSISAITNKAVPFSKVRESCNSSLSRDTSNCGGVIPRQDGCLVAGGGELGG